jgi:hypothetical protein
VHQYGRLHQVNRLTGLIGSDLALLCETVLSQYGPFLQYLSLKDVQSLGRTLHTPHRTNPFKDYLDCPNDIHQVPDYLEWLIMKGTGHPKTYHLISELMGWLEKSKEEFVPSIELMERLLRRQWDSLASRLFDFYPVPFRNSMFELAMDHHCWKFVDRLVPLSRTNDLEHQKSLLLSHFSHQLQSCQLKQTHALMQLIERRLGHWLKDMYPIFLSWIHQWYQCLPNNLYFKSLFLHLHVLPSEEVIPYLTGPFLIPESNNPPLGKTMDHALSLVKSFMTHNATIPLLHILQDNLIRLLQFERSPDKKDGSFILVMNQWLSLHPSNEQILAIFNAIFKGNEWIYRSKSLHLVNFHWSPMIQLSHTLHLHLDLERNCDLSQKMAFFLGPDTLHFFMENKSQICASKKHWMVYMVRQLGTHIYESKLALLQIPFSHDYHNYLRWEVLVKGRFREFLDTLNKYSPCKRTDILLECLTVIDQSPSSPNVRQNRPFVMAALSL